MTSQTKTDDRYKISRCSKCGSTFQNIDFGCAVHRFACKDFDAAVDAHLGAAQAAS